MNLKEDLLSLNIVNVKHILKQKLLMRKEGVLSPTFDIENVVIPAGFYPSKKSFTEEKQTQVNIKNMDKKNADSIVQRIAKKTDKDVKKVAIKIEEIADEKKILPEVAALLVAMEENVEVKDCFDAVESAIFIGENEE